MEQARNLLREIPSAAVLLGLNALADGNEVVVTRVVSAQPRRYVTIPLK
jgi:hypothetical protein